MTDRKPYRHRFPLSVSGYALRLYHRFPLSQRDVQELLHERGIQVSHETLRQWHIKFAPLLTEELRHREPCRGSRWFLDEVYVEIGGRKHWLWRAVDEEGDVLDILLQEHRNTRAARSFFVRLLGEYDVPEAIHTDKLWSYGVALQELPVLHTVKHVQVVYTARWRAVASPDTATGAKPTGLQSTAANAGISVLACPSLEPSQPHPDYCLCRHKTKQLKCV